MSASYNFVLWTMHFELYGSFLIFMFLALFGKHHNRWIFYALFSIVFLKTYFLGFIAGMVISDIYTNLPQLHNKLKPQFIWAGLLAGIVLGTWSVTSIYTGFYNHISIPFFNPYQLELSAHMIGAILVVLSVLELKILSRFFETRPLQYLGKISFSLYLTHTLVLGSLASYIFYRLLPGQGYKAAVLASVAVSLPVTFVIANLFTKYVDSPSIAFSKQAGDFLLNKNFFQDKINSRFSENYNYMNTLIRKRLLGNGNIVDEQSD